MSHALKVLLGIGVVSMLSGQAGSPGLVTQRNMSLGMAKAIAEATIAACKEKGYNTAAAVVEDRPYRTAECPID